MTVRGPILLRLAPAIGLLCAACGPAPAVIGAQLHALEQLGIEAGGRHKSQCAARPGAAAAAAAAGHCPALLACLESLSKAADSCKQAIGFAAKGDDSYAQQAKTCTAQADTARGQCVLTLTEKANSHGS